MTRDRGLPGALAVYWKSPAVKVGPFEVRLYVGRRGPSLNFRLARKSSRTD